MIVLYILLGIFLFLLLFLAFILFVPFKTYVQASFWRGDVNAMAEFYWIKYIFGARLRLLDMEKLKIIIWFFAIPIPLKLSLKKDKAQGNSGNEDKDKDDAEPELISVDEKEQSKEEPEAKKSLKEKIEDIIKVKDASIEYIRKNWTDIKKIFVTYVTFSVEHLELELGMDDPAKTGKMAGNLYTALSFVSVKRLNLSWDFQKKSFNIDAGVKIIMKFYGICLTLLKLYRSYKRKIK